MGNVLQAQSHEAGIQNSQNMIFHLIDTKYVLMAGGTGYSCIQITEALHIFHICIRHPYRPICIITRAKIYMQ